MDFFESQDIARRNTRFLLVLFILAVISLVVLTNLLVFAFVTFQDTARMATNQWYFDWKTAAAISAGVLALIAGASLFRVLLLRRGGGRAVAELMDGELLVDHGGNLHRRKLLNVVQEMAIASGTPVPPVYLIHDNAINAFAAGYSASDAVIGVTTGAMENLTRDELQGVIAHEFSHILNGDMRLNIRLMGILYGILVIALVGRMLLSPGRRTMRRDRSHAGVIAMGAGLMVIGYTGQFFGNMIKSAVSRQREFLADASAVQFTRNPAGISDALKRIGGYSGGSVVAHPESEEISHSFFSEGVTFSFRSIMATHPPLQERIRRIEPGWNGQFTETRGPAPDEESARTGTTMGFAATGVAINADDVVQRVGNPDTSQIETARELISALPGQLTDAAHSPYSARALVYLFLLDSSTETRRVQLAHLEREADLGVYEELVRLDSLEEKLTPGMKLPLLEMLLPALRQLSYDQYKLFLSNIDTLVRADGKVGLSEWAMQKMVRKHLAGDFESRHISVKYQQLEPVSAHCEILLSLLAYADHQSGVSPDAAFRAGFEEIDLPINLRDKSELSFNRLNTALDELAALHPLRKPRLIKACVRTVTADRKVAPVEAELLRLIADILECPMPPFRTNEEE